MKSEILVVDEDLVIRRMRDSEDDYALMVGWRNQPHVRHWWDPDDPPLNLATARDEYRPDTLPEAASTACIVELGGRPVGFIQFYLWSSYAQDAEKVGIPFDVGTWGIDIFIGERDHVGSGLGTRMMRLLCQYLESELGASTITLTTEIDNAPAIRCYEKAGFHRIVQLLDIDTRDGERVMTWLMSRGSS